MNILANATWPAVCCISDNIADPDTSSTEAKSQGLMEEAAKRGRDGGGGRRMVLEEKSRGGDGRWETDGRAEGERGGDRRSDEERQSVEDGE